MSFESRATITLPGTVSDVFTALSSKSQVISMMRLSPATVSVHITKRERVLLFLDLTYRVMSEDEFEADGETRKYEIKGSDGEVVRRLHFEMTEQVSFLGIPVSVTVVGTQLMSPRQHLHLYESLASNGLVKIRKLRRFIPVAKPASVDDKSNGEETRIEEHIIGQTNRLMRSYVGRECKRAHEAHVSQYHRLLPIKPP